MTYMPNVKLVVVAVIEGATGNPPGGWSPVGGSAAPPDTTSSLGPEFEAITFTAWMAF
jgi:hypothetical protein